MLWTRALVMLTFLLQISLLFSILLSCTKRLTCTNHVNRQKQMLSGFGQWGLPARDQRQGREWGEEIYSSSPWTGSYLLSAVTASYRKLTLWHFLPGCRYSFPFFIHLGPRNNNISVATNSSLMKSFIVPLKDFLYLYTYL